MKTINILFIVLLLGACKEENTSNLLGDWTVPKAEIFDVLGKDGIPALENPKMINAEEATYLVDYDLVLGYKLGNDVRAYPHPILDWHEIINDEVNGHPIAITYCPLTGTGIGWERTINGTVTTFGVSGLLYNTNLIPYDRLTESNWSQMRMECINGDLIGIQVETFNVVETTWETWRELYPQTKVVSTETGHDRNYQRYPYADYRSDNDFILFAYRPKDDRLERKERVHGIIVGDKVKIYRFEHFKNEIDLVEDSFKDIPVVVIGSTPHHFIVSFERRLSDGTELTFSVLSTEINGEGVLSDNEGNVWNIFGEAISGPRTGQQLTPTKSLMGFWFTWGSFYPGIEIYSAPG